jgi:hypothetical protein
VVLVVVERPAEGHMDELMNVPDLALSSVPWQTRHYRGRRLRERESSVDAFAHNEVILLLNILAYEVVHAGWCLMEAATKEGWSLRRFGERVLRAAARVVVSGHRVTMVIGEAFARSWHQLWPRHARITVWRNGLPYRRT